MALNNLDYTIQCPTKTNHNTIPSMYTSKGGKRLLINTLFFQITKPIAGFLFSDNIESTQLISFPKRAKSELVVREFNCLQKVVSSKF